MELQGCRFQAASVINNIFHFGLLWSKINSFWCGEVCDFERAQLVGG